MLYQRTNAESYPGGKNGSGVYQKIINLMPPHDVYIEPFLGGGAIMRLKRPASLNIGIDLAASAVSKVQACIASSGACGSDAAGNSGTRVPTLSAISAELAGSGGASVRIAGNGGPRSHIAGRGVPRSPLAEESDGRRRRSPKAARPAARYRNSESSEPAARNTKTCEASSFSFRRGDGIAFLEKRAFAGCELVYCDPPYLMSTRKGGRLYEHEMTVLQHRHLLRVIQGLPCFVMISGYWSKLYAETLRGWNSISFEAMTRGGSTATEWVWFNFPAPIELHDYRYLGENFRQRERIKRKKQRWVARLERMPGLERQALLAAIATIGGNGGGIQSPDLASHPAGARVNG